MQAERQRMRGVSLVISMVRVCNKRSLRRSEALDLDRAYADQAARLGQPHIKTCLLEMPSGFKAAGILGDFVDQRQRMEIDRLRNMEAAGEEKADSDKPC